MTDLSCRPLPVQIEEISRDWLTAALRSHTPDVEVRDFAIVDMIRGTCTKIRIRLDLVHNRSDDPIPETVILKGGFEPHSCDLWYMHEKEVRAYGELLPALKLRSPKAYFADFDAERQQGIVIMEDLVARGVTFCHPLQPHSYDAVAARLSALAHFHAGSWNSPDFRPGQRWDWIDDIGLNLRRYFNQFLEPDVWARFVGSPRGAAVSIRFHDLAWINDTIDRIAALAAMLPHCAVHGDTHLGNLYVDRDGAPGFYDPLAGRAPAMMEIAYHVAGALDVSDRANWEGPLVRHYLDALREAGVDAPSFEEAMRHYAVFLAFGYCVFIINEAEFQSEAINTAYTARFGAAMLDHDTIARLRDIAI